MFTASFNYLYQFMDSFSFLVLAVAGLAVIFGMMGIINLAHGEFIMMGAYLFTIFAKASLPWPIAVIAGAGIVGVFGYLMDRLVISRLYQRPLDSVVATWGISLLLKQGTLIILGPSVYRIVLGFIAVMVLIGMYVLFNHTRFGLHSRATMQNSQIAEALGINTRRMYSSTFMFGSVLAGLCGALYAPTMTITPTMGQAFQNESFVMVIVGGANPLVGVALSGGVLGMIQSILALVFGTFIGKIGLLLVAIIVIRVLPEGLSGVAEKAMMRKRR